jgi:hypothetical protein
MFKFKSKRSRKLSDMSLLLDGISDDLDDIKIDISDLQESVAEGLRLTLIVQEQCNELIEKIEKNNNRGIRNVG